MPNSQKFNLYQYLKNVGDDVRGADEPTSNQPSRTARGAGGSAALDARSRLRQLAAVEPVEQVIDDPVFNTEDAAKILGLKGPRLEKWRQRDMGPEYLQYDQDGIRYELSSLVTFKASRRVRPSRQLIRGLHDDHSIFAPLRWPDASGSNRKWTTSASID